MIPIIVIAAVVFLIAVFNLSYFIAQLWVDWQVNYMNGPKHYKTLFCLVTTTTLFCYAFFFVSKAILEVYVHIQ